MRRFVDTFAGKALCHLAAMALVLPTVTLGLARKAEAQITQLPSWAVTEFRDLKTGGASKYGKPAAEAVATELAKTNRYDVVPQESVQRSIETLGLSSPPEGLINLERIGQDVRATTIVQGEIVDYKVSSVGGGKQAVVAVRLVAYDVSSGLPVNGALETGLSTIRSGNVTDEALVTDAIGQAAAVAVRKIQGQQLPSATILNTLTRSALINQGTRSGFKSGDTVIISRGNVQVGTGRIGTVEPDGAEITYERLVLGVAPGDRVRAVFSPPALPPAGNVFTDNNGLNASKKPRGRSNNATLISALLVVGLVAVLLGSNHNSNSTSATAHVSAQATLDNGLPAVLVQWSPNGFFKGTGSSGNGVVRWQIYRNDAGLASPILVVGNSRNNVVDSSRVSNDEFPLQSFRGGSGATGQVGGIRCDNSSPSNVTRAAEVLPVSGTPYIYSVDAVYKVSSLDLPDTTANTTATSTTGTSANGGTNTSTTGTSTTGTSTTGTANTGGSTSTSSGSATSSSSGTSSSSTTAGTTAGTTSGSGTDCYFQSGKSFSGQATAIARPDTLQAQGTGTTINFTFASNQGAGSGAGAQQLSQQAVIEFSDDPSFPRKFSVAQTLAVPFVGTTGAFSSVNTTAKAFQIKGRSGTLLSATRVLYYRVGIRNLGDRPGPVADGTSGRRYIYSLPATFTRSNTTGNP